MDITQLSTKGQIILPKNIRTSRAWGPGTKFTSKKLATEFCYVLPVVFPRPISRMLPAACGRNGNREARRR